MGLEHVCLQNQEELYYHQGEQKTDSAFVFNLNTIKSSQDINFIFKEGKSFYFPFFIIIRISNTNIKGDIAFIAGKKCGNAVWRSKAKRRLRLIYRTLKKDNLLSNSYKYIFIAKKNLLNLKFKEEKCITCKYLKKIV